MKQTGAKCSVAASWDWSFVLNYLTEGKREEGGGRRVTNRWMRRNSHKKVSKA